MISAFSSFYRQLFLSKRFFVIMSIIVLLFVASYFSETVFAITNLLFLLILVLVVADVIFLFRIQNPLSAIRITDSVFSNGDQNTVEIIIESYYAFTVYCEVIDEIPFQFQKRDLLMEIKLQPGAISRMKYDLRPVARGSYHFGNVNVFVKSPLGVVMRRLTFEQQKTVAVYPSYMQLKQFRIMAGTNRLSEMGVKQIRRIGHSMEFEHIRNYVAGDDYRSVNWKATARSRNLMVNNYQDEKSQQVYCVIDKGRLMKMPFENMTLLDYAINASLVLNSICIQKQDKAGLITFSKTVDGFLPASRNQRQMKKLNELLYNQQTDFPESDIETLYATIRTGIAQRSLLILFTNFETCNAFNRQLPYLRKLAQLHLLLIVFFENTEVKKVINQPSKSIKEIYIKSMAEKLEHEKRLIAQQLKRFGIHALYTTPAGLTANAINRYFEFKSRGLL